MVVGMWLLWVVIGFRWLWERLLWFWFWMWLENVVVCVGVMWLILRVVLWQWQWWWLVRCRLWTCCGVECGLWWWLSDQLLDWK